MKKERNEWIHSWQDENFKDDLPRVLLVGDSITHNYQSYVRKMLKGVCYVDYVATSFAIDTAIYFDLIKDYAEYNRYDLIHFNNGLHGIHISKNSYKKRLKKMIEMLIKNSKVILVNSTVIYKQNNEVLDNSWMKRVKERNEAVDELSGEFNLKTDDLFSVSCNIPKDMRYKDGTHYKQNGYIKLAEQVAKIIRENL